MADTIPATLDLADHGRMAIHGILGSLNPSLDYECTFLTIFDAQPPYMLHWSSMVSGVMPKYVEALPLLRHMSGSREQMDLQDGFMRAMRANMAEDGLVYDRSSPRRPWNCGVGYGVKGWDADYASLAGNARLLNGLATWHQATGDDEWKQLAKRTAERMLELAIVRDDIAYYPNCGLGNDFSYPRVGGWTTTDPPDNPEMGCEGATLFYQFQPLRGFSRYYRMSGDERFLEMSRKFAALGLKRNFWGADHDMHPEPAAERGHFRKHLHAGLAAVRGLLDYAVVSDDYRLKLLARDSYEWARQHGIHRLGIFANHPDLATEGCTLADVVAIAVTLSDEGIGDYWDDVEQVARNGLVEAQMTDPAEMERVAAAAGAREPNAARGGHYDWRFTANNRGVLPGQEIHEGVVARSVGAFGWIHGASWLTPMLMHCCTANGSQGLFYAWEAILRRRDWGVEINLWLNRRSPWVDVCSELPHAGRLKIVNKGMAQISVRKPGWARASAIRCTVDGRDAQPEWSGNRMRFRGLSGRERIVLTVSVVTEESEYTVAYLQKRDTCMHRYRCAFRGHTAVKLTRVSLPGDPPDRDWYRAFRRDSLMATDVPERANPAYIHPERMPL
jgi:hypothetical protein